MTCLLAALLALTSANMGELERYTGELQAGQTTKYFYTIPDWYNPEWDFLLKVIPESDLSDPDVYISAEDNIDEGNYWEAKWQCSSYGKDTCGIPHSELEEGMIFTVIVKCIDNCKFELEPTFENELELNNGVPVQIYFETDETKIFKFKIPRQGRNSGLESITITAAPTLSVLSDVELEVSKDPAKLGSSSAIKGVAAWKKGKIVRITKDTNSRVWCTDCTLYITVDANEAGRYQLTAETNQRELKLYKDQKLDDLAYYGSTNCYTYVIKDAVCDFEVKATMYSGIVSLYVNPLKRASSLENSQFKSEAMSAAGTGMVIKADERDSAYKNGVYYVCIHAVTTSTYSVKVDELWPLNTYFRLDDSYIEEFNVSKHDHGIYVYKVPQLDYEGEDLFVDFKMTTISGATPEMSGKFCYEEDPELCIEQLNY